MPEKPLEINELSEKIEEEKSFDIIVQNLEMTSGEPNLPPRKTSLPRMSFDRILRLRLDSNLKHKFNAGSFYISAQAHIMRIPVLPGAVAGAFVFNRLLKNEIVKNRFYGQTEENSDALSGESREKPD